MIWKGDSSDSEAPSLLPVARERDGGRGEEASDDAEPVRRSVRRGGGGRDRFRARIEPSATGAGLPLRKSKIDSSPACSPVSGRAIRARSWESGRDARSNAFPSVRRSVSVAIGRLYCLLLPSWIFGGPRVLSLLRTGSFRLRRVVRRSLELWFDTKSFFGKGALGHSYAIVTCLMHGLL